MKQDILKKLAAEFAIKYVEDNMIVGVGTGSTVNYFIEKLASKKYDIKGAVSSSNETTKLLKQHDIEVLDANSVLVDVYIDGADEINNYHQMIKGGGAALTREKIIASIAKKFICIIDESKFVTSLGKKPIPIEVIPMARSYVGREIVKLGGTPEWRNGVITDNGNWIIDAYNLPMTLELEEKLNNISGVIANGLFIKRPANVIVIAKHDGTIELREY